MSQATFAPYSWLRTLSKETLSYDKIPLFGAIPPFNLSLFANELAKALGVQLLDPHTNNFEWRPSSTIENGLGDDPYRFSFSLSPLEGEGILLVPRQEIKSLFNELLTSIDKDITGVTGADEPDFLEEFTEFCAIEIAAAFQKSNFDGGLTLNWTCLGKEEGSVIPEVYLTIDLEMLAKSFKLHPRVAITPKLRESLVDKFASKSITPKKATLQSMTVTAQVIAGHTSMTKALWNEVTPGDFVIVDSLLLIPGEEKGRVLVEVNEIPLFRGKLKDGNLKLLEYPVLQEVQRDMAKLPEDEFEEEFEDSDSRLEADEENFEEEPEEEEGLEEEEPEEEETSQQEAEMPSKAPLAKPQPTSKNLNNPLGGKAQPVRPEEIPLSITIEVARIQMTVEKLMELQPGNVLELDIHPEDGVDLIVNNRCIARGELLKVGDLLGVRILEKA